MKRAGQTLVYAHPPVIAAHASLAGPKEGRGPLAEWFDEILPDEELGQKSWELAEVEMQRRCVQRALTSAGLPGDAAPMLLGGDLNNQIMPSSFAARALDMPFVGLYGACSTFVQALALGAALVDGGYLDSAVCCASSHYCTAERQFRFPLELGAQRPPQASWTATACGCAVLAPTGTTPLRVTSATLGRVVDLNITDANHMGAAMAPAVFDTLCAHLEDTGRAADEIDLIATGDLGWIGRALLIELCRAAGLAVNEDRLIDCGASLFDAGQDAHAGGSGCGCVASVSCGWLMKRAARGELRRVLIIGSGALLSPASSQQGQSVPGIAHAVCVERSEEA